ncbi:hypothetical protein ACIO3O_06100 [Streptomyces sp. NPDC087440]|uniref:hypothetical protein n=1 Tax=Streptomyces sp. NPDC087440 TaxID=3365790 RepID=UPI003810FC60
MTNTGARRDGTPEVVLTDRGGTARFDGARVQLVRGPSTWHIPVRALHTAELTGDGRVRIALAEGSGDHGLGTEVLLPAASPVASEAFADRLHRAIRAAGPADGPVRVRREIAAPCSWGPRNLGRRARLLVQYAGLALLLAPLFLLAGLLAPPVDGLFYRLAATELAMLTGSIVLWRVGQRVRSLWLLRLRGIGVVGEVIGYVHIWDRGGHLWEFSKLAYTTLDGQYHRGVPSVVTVWGLSDKVSGKVDLLYDPQRPTRASRPLTVGFAFRTLLLAAVGAVPAFVGTTMLLSLLLSG